MMQARDPLCGLFGHGAWISEHERRVQFLEALATLFGCVQEIGCELPDGRRPDVVRLCAREQILLLGEAKDTESPGNVTTQVRLFSYMEWLKAHIDRIGRTGILAICFGRETQTRKWGETVRFLGKELCMNDEAAGLKRFDRDTRLVWFVYRAVPIPLKA